MLRSKLQKRKKVFLSSDFTSTDLNNNSFSDIYNFISKGRNDAFLEKGSGFGSTYRFPFFPLRIDYIFTSKNIKVLDFKTYDIKLSDHKPILAKLQWP